MMSRSPRLLWTRLAALAGRTLEQFGDPAQPSHYRDANASVGAEVDPRQRVVFLGDSIFEGWRGLEALAPPGLRFINRGIAGQTSGQMLARFRHDVLSLGPSAVAILAGTNDLRAFMGDPAVVGAAAAVRVARNITAMADLARGSAAPVILCALPPIRPGMSHAWGGAAKRDPGAILQVNAWLSDFSIDGGYVLIDFHAALADEDGGFARALTDDGLHPNAAGYGRMAAVLSGAIEWLTLQRQVIP